MDAGKVIVIGDNADHVEVIRSALEQRGLPQESINLAADPPLTGVLADDGSPEARVILLDVEGASSAGMDVLRQVKADPMTRAIPVVVFTAPDHPSNIDTAYRLGANSVVARPESREGLARAAQELGIYWGVLNLVSIC